MNGLKKFLRLLCLACLMTLACIGLGVPASFNNREKYLDYEVKIEQVESREEEDLVEVDEQTT